MIECASRQWHNFNQVAEYDPEAAVGCPRNRVVRFGSGVDLRIGLMHRGPSKPILAGIGIRPQSTPQSIAAGVAMSLCVGVPCVSLLAATGVPGVSPALPCGMRTSGLNTPRARNASRGPVPTCVAGEPLLHYRLANVNWAALPSIATTTIGASGRFAFTSSSVANRCVWWGIATATTGSSPILSSLFLYSRLTMKLMKEQTVKTHRMIRAAAAFSLVLCVTAPLSAEWKPVAGGMVTEWGRQLKPDQVWTEYPRPQFVRDAWTNLNGLWSYAVTAKDAGKPTSWAGEILVPFGPESALSGVGRLIEPTEALWYRRILPPQKPGLRTLLHFEAVDYQATVWLNGREIGAHTGGHTPFSFDVTEALRAGENELVLRVLDETEAWQLHGKQHLVPGGIWYTRVTGIWQTVWMEQVPPMHLTGLGYACDIEAGTVTITPTIAGQTDKPTLRIAASFEGKPVAKAEGAGPVTLTLPQPKLWTPDTPHLYDLNVELLGADGRVADTVKAYTALRVFGKAQDTTGRWHFTLNGKPLFHWGPLDQGWWPDGLLTPPSDAAMRSDIEYLKAAGFNMIRKHIKVEPRRYYYHCDRLGMLMWQDQVSNGGGKSRGPDDSSPPWTRMAPNPKDATWPSAAHQQWVTEYKRMVDHLRDAPCIAVWVPFNEAWGQHDTIEVGKMAAAYDRTRLINIASGGNFWPVGDVADHHHYPHPEFPSGDARFADYVRVVGEFGGHGLVSEGHVWGGNTRVYSYGDMPKNLDEWKRRYVKSLDDLIALRKLGIAAGVYTQTTDVERELNGFLTYDRIKKVDPAWLKAQAVRLLAD
jgi:hypothetical protein